MWVVVLKLTGTAALEEDAQILKVIEAYCTGASLHQTTTGTSQLPYDASISGNDTASVTLTHCTHAYTAVRKDSIPAVLLPEEEKIIVEEMKSNGQTITEEKYVKLENKWRRC